MSGCIKYGTNDMIKTLLLAAATLIAATGASATTIVSSSFDSIANAPGNGGFRIYAAGTVVDGWTAGANGIEVQASAAGTPFSGRHLIELDTNRNSSMFLNLQPGTYRVSYFYSPRPGVSAASNQIDLLFGNRLLDSVTALGGNATSWSQRRVDFSTRSAGALTFAAAGTSDSRGGYLDNISVSAVPEASTWMMLVVGFAAIGYGMRRNPRSVAA
jgi:hypothetical protein